MPTYAKMILESPRRTEEEITNEIINIHEILVAGIDPEYEQEMKDAINALTSQLDEINAEKTAPASRKLVTKESLIEMIESADENKLQAIIGRALVGIFNRQTEDEKVVNDTRIHNLRGFTPADAHCGSITAKYFLKHRRLLDWQIDKWLKPNNKGVPRIAKYWRQLNEIANEKRIG